MPVLHSQLDPLPDDLPFRLVSKTIARGAYASIRKAAPLNRPSPVFAVKFIHKDYAVRQGRISNKQIAMEVTLHHHIGQHHNIIQFYTSDENSIWRWIAMEYAEGGDLFDKVEADVGVSEDVAHFYFSQLVSGVSYMHSKGVGHRDIKPENILLSSNGSLKLADFGLATLFLLRNERKTSSTMCGSPPYIAPEVISCGRTPGSKQKTPGYSPDQVDVWSCGVVLFVLLVGNTPWDEPSTSSWEFNNYLANDGRSSDELWQHVPNGAISLLRGMMKVDPAARFTFEDVRRHPWFARPNPYLSSDGKAASPISLATAMLEGLKIDFSPEPTMTQRLDSMDLDGSGAASPTHKYSSTQPEMPINDMVFDWERPPRAVARERWSASQPTNGATLDSSITNGSGHLGASGGVWDRLAEDPSMSQFSAAPAVPLSLTQRAQRFQDIVPAQSLTRFFSHLPHNLLLPLISESLQRLGVPTPALAQSALQGLDSATWIKVRTVDGRHCRLSGDVVVERTGIEGYQAGEELLEVRFTKHVGDPLEWRRFFKKVVVYCKEGVFMPDGMDPMAF